MNRHLERFSIYLPFILLTIGIICGFVSFFVNWETLTVADTTGFDLAFGKKHEEWYYAIGIQCYIPLIVLLCTIGAFLTVSIKTYRGENSYVPMLVCFILGIVMIFCMVSWSATSMYNLGGKVYFADFIGMGTKFAWTASTFTMIGGGMYIASHWGPNHEE